MKITGKDLIAMGYKQGKWFKQALIQVNKNRLVDTELRAFLDLAAPKIIEPHLKAVPFYKNIEAENEIEISNIESVFNTMTHLMRTPTLISGAVMPDACPTGGMGHIPVGGISVAHNAIHPGMHSADICCSVMMTSLGYVDPKSVLDMAHKETHFGGGGRPDNHFTLPESFIAKMKENYFLKSDKSIFLAKSHLGTQGDGNHFLYVGKSENTGETVLVTHHGSRGLGANLYKHGMAVAESFRAEISPSTLKCNAWIPYEEQIGKDYWDALQIVREWTKMNHSVIHRATYKAIQVEPTLNFWNEHNFVFKDGENFFHAKGATPLDERFVPDSHEGLRLIPLNMREPILVVRGKTTETNLGFAPHGAGREISRTQHIKNQANRTIEAIFAEETNGLDIRFYSGNIDISELPSAYKSAAKVQAQMEKFGLGEIVDRIMPYGCIMAGDWKMDAPWKKRRMQRNAKK